MIPTFTKTHHTNINLRQLNPVLTLPSCFFKTNSDIILLPTRKPPKFYSFQIFQLKFCMNFSASPYALHNPPISSPLVLSIKQHLLNSTNFEVYRHACAMYQHYHINVTTNFMPSFSAMITRFNITCHQVKYTIYTQ